VGAGVESLSLTKILLLIHNLAACYLGWATSLVFVRRNILASILWIVDWNIHLFTKSVNHLDRKKELKKGDNLFHLQSLEIKLR
jgi:hypothetical protein